MVAVLAAGLLSGCAVAGIVEPDVSSARPRSVEQRAVSEDAVRQYAATSRELEEKVARQHLQLLEKDAEIRALNHKLEAAILEVVRAMAKLRGLSGRAEAASALAETEIALKSMPPAPALRLQGRRPRPGPAAAEARERGVQEAEL